MLDEMSMKECTGIDGTIDLTYLAAREFKNVDFVICMNPRLPNKHDPDISDEAWQSSQKDHAQAFDSGLNIKYTLKGTHLWQ